MALDPSIALGVKPLQIPDPMESYGKALQLKNLMVQQQAHAQQIELGAEQLKGAQQENQVRQQGITDDAAARKLFAQPGGMPEDSQILSTLGPAHGGAVLKSLREADKFKVDLQESKGKVAALEADYAGSLAAGVKAAGNSPDALHLAIQHARAAGYEQEAKQMEQLLAPENQGHIGAVMDQLIAKSPKQRELNTAAETAAAHTGQAKTAADKFQAEKDLIAANTKKAQDEAAGKAPIQPAQQATIDQAKDTAAQTAKRDAENARNHLSSEAIARQNSAIASGRLKLEQTVNGMKYGPGTQEYWVKQLQENPDSIKEMPAELRSTVGQGFLKATGLPLPSPASAASQTQETAARNALDGAQFIQKALMNPEIRKNLGPIMGRLGNAEQAAGTAPNLSPEATKIAQELRTRMRYFVFQEGKSLFGGRVPQQLMQQLESSSANPKMDPDMLQGALNGAVGNAQSVMDNVDKQRFGGKMRPPTMRGSTPAPQGGTVRYTSGGITYNIPAGDEAEFLKDHPGAKK